MALLLVERGPQKGQTVRVEQGRVVRVGRAADCDLVLSDPLVSRYHFEVEGRDGDFFIRDTGSTNGTYLRGERLTGERKLQVGDRIELGDCLLTFIPHERWRKQDTVTGQTVAGYLITERIGQGGMGTVYKALQLSLDRTVALKILSPELCRDTKFVEMFVREARNAGQLNHPNIVHVYDVGKWQDVYYLSMEFMAGGSVADMIRRQKRIKPRHVIPMAIDAARGLEYAEQRGIIHRDIKPANLMLTEEGTVKIGDLGIARRVPPGGAIKEERLWGSPLYMAPEQARCDTIDHRADIYALGATIYHMLTGTPPVSGKTLKEIILKQIKEKPPPIKELAPDVPEPLCQVVEKMLEKDPQKRFQSAGEVIDALEELKKRVRVARPALAEKQVYRRLLIVVGALAGVVVATVIFALALSAIMRARKERLQKRRKAFMAELAAFEREWEKARGAAAETPAARIRLLRQKYKALLTSLESLGKEYSDLEEVSPRLKTAKQMMAEGWASELAAFEKEGLTRLAEAVRFWERHKRSFNEAENLFLLVAKEFAGSAAAKKAEEMAEKVRRAREAHRKRLQEAERLAERLIGASREFARRGEFKKARARLEMFPLEFSDTPAAARIKAEVASLILAEREALDGLKQKVLQLLRAGKIEEARQSIEEREPNFTLSDAATLFDELRRRLEEAKKAQQEERRRQKLRQDSESLAGFWEEARTLCAKFQPDAAVDTLRRAELRLQTTRYRRLAKIALLIINTWKNHHRALIAAINSSSLRHPVTLKIGRFEGPVAAADENRVFIRLGEGPKAPQTSQRWTALSVSQLLTLYNAMEKKPQNELALTAFLILRGMENEAASKLQTITDPALSATVNCFKEFLRWLK